MEKKTQKPKLISKLFKSSEKNNDILKYPQVKIELNPKVPPLKKELNKTKINIRYGLIPPFAFAHIYWDKKISEVLYKVEEPILTEEETKHKNEIITAMKDMIDFNTLVEKDIKKLIEYIDKMFKILAVELGIKLTYESYKKIFYHLYRDFVGFNEVEPLLSDYFIEDIECNGVNTPIYVVHRVYRNIKSNLKFNDIDNLSSFVEKLAQKCGKYISYANPILDGSLPDGSRVNATYTKDITSRGPTFTIRKFTKTPWTPPQLLEKETLSPEMLAYIWLLLEYKMNILIAGGTASGKTTLLNAMAFFIPPEARVVSIEDTRELSLPRENWLPSVVRTATGVEKTGEVDLFTLLRASFRQNPDYVIVGEVRGKEASVLFQGMASGHSSIGTIHADSVDTVIKRLETPPIELSPSLLNVLDCICVMTHAVVKKQETRKLREVVEIINVAPNGVTTTNTPFVWNAKDNQFYFKKNSRIFDKISRRYGLTIKEIEEEFKKRTQLVYKLLQNNVIEFNQVQDVINKYYKNSQSILNEFKIT
ncbi:MAG: type II/IV secretion system ATPase subunit [Nanoarchaeota archaeon]